MKYGVLALKYREYYLYYLDVTMVALHRKNIP